MKIFNGVDKKLIKILFWYYTTVVLLSLMKKIFWKLQITIPGVENQKFITIDWFILVVYNIFFDWIVVIFLMICVAHLTQKMIKRKIKLTSWYLSNQ